VLVRSRNDDGLGRQLGFSVHGSAVRRRSILCAELPMVPGKALVVSAARGSIGKGHMVSPTEGTTSRFNVTHLDFSSKNQSANSTSDIRFKISVLESCASQPSNTAVDRNSCIVSKHVSIFSTY
jgi:hypothetical protein